jgi:hypothetical protein
MTATPHTNMVRGCRHRLLCLSLAGAATVVLLLPYDAAQPHGTVSTPASGAALLTRLEFPPQAPTRLARGGFAADDAADQAQQQLSQQQLQQAMQQAQEQSDAAEQQFNQDMQQQQTYENQFNNP